MADIDASSLKKSAFPCDMLDIVAQPIKRYLRIENEEELASVRKTYGTMHSMTASARAEDSMCADVIKTVLECRADWPDRAAIPTELPNLLDDSTAKPIEQLKNT